MHAILIIFNISSDYFAKNRRRNDSTTNFVKRQACMLLFETFFVFFYTQSFMRIKSIVCMHTVNIHDDWLTAQVISDDELLLEHKRGQFEELKSYFSKWICKHVVRGK